MPNSSARYQQITDEELMTGLADGDTEAFDELYHRYNKRLLYYFYRMLGHSEEKSQDFLQDIFLKIIEKPELFNQQKKFSTWLFSIAHNMCKNEYRSREVRKIVETVDNYDPYISETTQPDNIDLGAFTTQLYKELDLLDEVQKTAFLLRYREGFPIKEISLVMDCSEGTVKSRLFYTNKKLAERLKIFNPQYHKN